MAGRYSRALQWYCSRMPLVLLGIWRPNTRYEHCLFGQVSTSTIVRANFGHFCVECFVVMPVDDWEVNSTVSRSKLENVPSSWKFYPCVNQFWTIRILNAPEHRTLSGRKVEAIHLLVITTPRLIFSAKNFLRCLYFTVPVSSQCGATAKPIILGREVLGTKLASAIWFFP